MHNKSLKNVSRFTLLKSPHVHKSAQHEFKQQTYKKQLLFILFNNTTLIFFKKLFFYFFQDIRKNCTFNFQIYNKRTYLNCKLFKINIVNILVFLSNKNSYWFSILRQNENRKIKKLKNYFKILNLLGKNMIN